MIKRNSSYDVLTGLAAIAGRYRGFIVDLWGVVHDGTRSYPSALEALDRLRSGGAKVCLLSNSPRRVADVMTKLDEMGIGQDRYDCLVTSGELTMEALVHPPDSWHAALGSRYLHLGPVDGFGLLAALPQGIVSQPCEADFVLCTGTDPGQVVKDYAGILVECARWRLPMLCANPDIIVHIGRKSVICAGALAAHYETLGCETRYHGKPYLPAYQRCLQMLELDGRSVLAIGDAMNTDVAGAKAASIDVAFISSGIHRKELAIERGEMPSPSRLSALMEGSRHRPDFVLSHLTW